MSVTRRRTLAEAHLALEAMISEVATLIEVVADDDMPDAHDDYTLQSMFTKQVSERFAEQLVYRILHDDDFILEWRGSEDERRRRDREKYRGEPEEPDEDDTEAFTPTVADSMDYERQRKIEHAHAFRVGDIVTRISDPKRVKTRGTIKGRDADDPTRLHIAWGVHEQRSWHFAEDLLATGPSDIYIEPDASPEDDETDDDPAEMPMVTEEKKKR